MCSGGGGVGGTSTVRKGPWTETEDAQLSWFVRLLGERRWDFLAQVSGLRRTGKSCRLRWVNYLHPGLKRGRITADEERLILHLHAQWGSRWSRIAARLPGRTDNEIKNYWRTHMRKKAHQEKLAANNNKKKTNITTSFSSSSSSLNVTSSSTDVQAPPRDQSSCCNVDEEEATTAASSHQEQRCFAMEMDQMMLWSEDVDMICSWPGSTVAAEPPTSPAWELCADYSLWTIDDEEYYNKIL